MTAFPHSPTGETTLDRLSARETAKNAVIASGNAQAVFRRLGEIEADRAANLNRWAWELLQNARDAAGAKATVSVAVAFDGTTLTFQHDGPPFRDEEIAHLIFHGSTKHDERAGIGRFGTGFISTHLLSRVVRIRGPLDDGTVFDFKLDRTGDNADELKDSMNRSWETMNASIRPANDSVSELQTTFSYPIGSETSSVVTNGLNELRRVAPFILAFNPQFSSLSITANEEFATYRARERRNSDGGVYELRIADGGGQDISRVIVSEKGDVKVAIAMSPSDEAGVILPGPGMSRVYVAFPLSTTDRFPIRAAINSEKFHPRTERDGIYLDTDDSLKNTENRPRFECACDAFGPLVEYAARTNLPDFTDLLALTLPLGLESVNVEWLTTIVKTRVVDDLLHRPIVISCNGTCMSLRDAVIPFAEAGRRQWLWNTFASLKDMRPKLPREKDIDNWNDVLVSWSHFTGQPPEHSESVWDVEDLISDVADCRTVAVLEARVEGDAWDWLSSLIDLLGEEGRFDLLAKYSILPNQRGELKSGDELLLDQGIPDELKDLAEDVGLQGRAKLLATQLSKSCYASELEAQSSDDVLHAIIDRLDEADEKSRAAAIRLFGFVLKKRLRNWLERIPIMTAGDSLNETKIALGASTRERLLAPVKLWEGNMREFGDVFPAGFIMHDDYAELLSENADWTWLVEQGAVCRSPLVTDDAQVEDFVGMMRKGSGGEEFRTKHKITRSHLMYLVGDESVLERVRGSRRLGILLVRFLLEAVIPKNANAFVELEVECEDDEKRSCYSAAWIAQLLSRVWVKSDKRANYLSAESLANLLADQPGVVKLLLDEKSGPFLKSVDISPADLALRSVGKTETDRMSLIRSLGVIADAVGNDPVLVARFAATIQSDTTLLAYIQQRGIFIDRVERNQSFGFAVEREFKASFSPDMGVTITRTGLGHDFMLSPTAGEEDDAGLVEIAIAERKIYVELKATRGSDAVYMSVRQVQSATETPDIYWLCVVVIEDGDVTSDAVQSKARFICDIGSRLKSAWSQYEDLRNATPASSTVEGEPALEVSGQEVKFRIGHKLWMVGLSFDEAMTKLKAGLDGVR